MLKTLAAIVIAAGLACAAAPASTPTHTVPAGVRVGGVLVGGLSAEPARARIDTAFGRSLRVTYRAHTTWISPASLEAAAGVDAAVSSALTATPRSRIALPLRFSHARVARAVAQLARRYDRSAVNASVVGATAAGPVFSAATPGLAVDVRATASRIAAALRDGTRARLRLVVRPVAPARTPARFGPVIVVTRGSNSLRLYSGRTLERTFPVATGQAIYPTPAGIWRIMDKQRDPWWYPPTQDAWAKGLSPVPPGPSNPLGTRWMGLNAPGVGIHGTDAPTSIGYSASHGCIRMQVPDAEWLFEHVSVGTPVVIL